MSAQRKEIHHKLPKRMAYILLGLALIIVALLILAYPFLFSRTETAATIRIPANATPAMLADSLSKYYGKSFSSRVMRIYGLRPVNLSHRHGSYRIEAGENPINVARRLTRGGQTPVRITVNGFRDLNLLCERIASKLDFPADSLRNAIKDADLLGSYGLTPDKAMALFINDTYEVYWNVSPRELINKIGNNYTSYWSEENIRKAKDLGLEPADAMILASIVDEETNDSSEKGTIGRLYINRLQKGMRLQSDPTVRFALNDFTIRRVKAEHLKANSPYNTYIRSGLPPGPIRTTSRATLDAILNSTPNSYLYMCAKEDFSGSHNFAVTFDEHSQNARRYRNALNQRGIK